MFRPTILLLSLLTLTALCARATGRDMLADPGGAVYKIRVEGGGRVTDGSAVLIAPGRLLTACHVTRRAESIRVGRANVKWLAYPAMTDIEHDLCTLTVMELSDAKPAAIGRAEQLRLGEPVIAAGYPRGGRLDIGYGEIKGLHAYDGASLIQVSTPFDYGQSGGGLFDTEGRLIGIIGFKAVAGGNFHYALPLTWAGAAIPGQTAIPAITKQREQAFWQSPIARMPLFLRAASLEANREWETLHDVAQQWVIADENNPASWLCLGRILTRLKRDQAAARAFGHAAALMPSVEGASRQTASPPVKVAEVEIPSASLDRRARQ